MFELNCAIDLVHQVATKELPASAKQAEQALQIAVQTALALQAAASTKEQKDVLGNQVDQIRLAAKYLASKLNRGFSYELYTYVAKKDRAVGITFGLAAVDGDAKRKGEPTADLLVSDVVPNR